MIATIIATGMKMGGTSAVSTTTIVAKKPSFSQRGLPNVPHRDEMSRMRHHSLSTHHSELHHENPVSLRACLRLPAEYIDDLDAPGAAQLQPALVDPGHFVDRALVARVKPTGTDMGISALVSEVPMGSVRISADGCWRIRVCRSPHF